ncbi:hypothetical protein M2347_003204 [Chryseobacterium sp. H1D6B]|uniref:hypothetical protein n=1 Tax=Chryseobacterium sp. H1D6B TaxID=2940588 RepID=UPI0015C7EB40|nr:hypothetical protein [Chryseobacterium sp. H1D6B]MDH6253477.1 hypothetical protein [Chryseobacterium sp. H1D6B]
MELDTLKNNWNTISVDINRDEFDIISATKKEMTSPLARLKKRATKQTKILPVLFAFLVVIAAKVPNAADSFLIWTALVILPITTIYYYFNLKLISELELFKGSVKNDIQTKIKRLINSNMIYLIFIRAVFAVLIILFELFLRDNRSNLIPGLETMKTIVFPLRLVIYAGILIIHYLISSYTFNLYFGKHIKQLKSILADMQ